MSLICNEGIIVPSLTESPCPNGEFYNDACVVHENAIVSLGLPVNSSLETIINTLVIALLYKEEQIQSLTARVEALEE